MLSRWVRAVLFGASVLALWLVALPALAAEPPALVSTYVPPTEPPPAAATKNVAGYCDDRGATFLAPPPIVQAPEASLDVDDDAAFDCSIAQLERSIQPDQRDRSDSGSSFDVATTLSRAVPVVPDPAREVLAAPTTLASPPAGIHARVERPPRG